MAESLKRKEITKEETKTYVHRRHEEKEETGIETNTFYSIIMADDVELEEKVNQVSKALEFTNDKEADRIDGDMEKALSVYSRRINDKPKQNITNTSVSVFVPGFNPSHQNKLISLVPNEVSPFG